MAFSDSIWWTRKARIRAEKRLLSNAFQSQLLQLWYSFSGVSVSIYYLKFNSTHADLAGISWVVYSVLTLCMSGFITGLSFKERAGLIKECYEALNNIYFKAKDPNADATALSQDYKNVLDLCENHTDYDYYSALCIEYITCTDLIDPNTGFKKGWDRRPSWYHWLSIIWWSSKRYSMLAILYLIPVFLFIGLDKL